MKRELILAVAVGVVAGLLGALTARSSSHSADGSQGAAQKPSDAHEDFEGGDLPARARAGAQKQSVSLDVAVSRASAAVTALSVNLSRWSSRAGMGGEGEWVALAPAATDAVGTAHFELTPGTYWVSAAGAAQLVDVLNSRRVELKLEPAVIVSGRILEAGTRAPLGGAFITARRTVSGGFTAPESETASTQSDSLGRFSFESLPQGRTHLEVAARGHRTQETDVSASDAIEVMLERSCHVTGVVSAQGQGVEAASVSEVDVDNGTLTDARGAFALDVDCGGGAVLAKDQLSRIGTTKFVADPREVNVTLEAGATLKGSVTLGGQPLAGADVVAQTGDEHRRARTVTDERGAFVLSPLLPGNYIVRARKGRGTFAAAYGVDVPQAKDLVLEAESGAVLEGHVHDGPGADVKLTWSNSRGERPMHVTADDEGAFRIEDVPAGAATLTALLGSSSADVAMFFTAGHTAAVEIDLHQHGRIVGIVAGPDHAGAHVTAQNDSQGAQMMRSALADADGNFVIEVPPGTYFMSARSNASHNLTAHRFNEKTVVVAGQDVHADLELLWPDAGEGWGEMPSVARGAIGASFENVNGSVQLSWLVGDSPASRAGLEVGDLVTAIDGQPVHDALDVFSRTRGAPGASVEITFRRSGAERTVAVALAK